jgi:hypothetical protein
MDQGFTGTLQHVFIHQGLSGGDNCFEVSNQSSDFDATPKTSPMVCNTTCVGSGAGGGNSKGLTIKEGTQGSWYANIFANTTNEATNLADEATYEEANAGNLEIANNIFFGIQGSEPHVSGANSLDSAGWADWINAPARANLQSDPGFGSVEWGNPDITPSSDVSGDGSGCGGTSYIGAVDPSGDNWTDASWINYTP